MLSFNGSCNRPEEKLKKDQLKKPIKKLKTQILSNSIGMRFTIEA